MIERVAKAIAAQDTEGLVWQEYISDARAAIAAMREPTEAMKNCSDEIHWGYSCHVCGGLKDGWYAMIDATLKGEPK